jgi:formamidopyrimidine-DNA glycosylase
MPELPEVETIARSLRERLLNLEFSRIEVHLQKCFPGNPGSPIDSLKRKKILKIERRGKNIIFHLSGGIAMMVHLRMSGKLRIVPSRAPREKHTHVIFSFRNHSHQLRYIDPRQFGRIWMERKGPKDPPQSLAHLGPEPLEISVKEFIRRAQSKKKTIKSLLLDQRFLAGVGNIYADEVLYRIRVHPRRRADSLGEKVLRQMHKELQKLLKEAIRARGTSVRSYVDAAGAIGGFQNLLGVYGKEGEPCPVCGTSIQRECVGGRSSFFCPLCQPPAK